MSDEFWEKRLASVEATIEQYEAARLVVLDGGTNYSLDSGQTRISVTQSSLATLERNLQSLINQREMILTRCNRGSGYQGRPC